jgi:hypothetical protein
MAVTDGIEVSPDDRIIADQVRSTHVHDPSAPDHDLDARAVPRRAHRLRSGPFEASGHTYTFMRRPDGRTDVDAVVVREGRNLKGRPLGLVLGTVGKSVLQRAFDKTIKAVEGRNTR